MNPTLLTPAAKDTLSKTIRTLRTRLLETLTEAARGEYQLDVKLDKAQLPEARRCKRERLETWLDEQARAAKKSKATPDELRKRFLQQAVKQAAHTWLNRLVFMRILEHHALLQPAVITGGWDSPAYAQEFIHYAGPLAQDDSRGYRHLLDVVFADLALDLPGLYGPVGLVPLFPMPAPMLRELIEALNAKELESAWGDDTTLGWIYQYWNDPEREALDAKINDGGKIEPHEIASKTQMFTERYMVEWLLQNSLGLTWLCICKKNGWTPDAERVLPVLEARRAEWRAKRDAGEVALDALMPIQGELEDAWKYYVPQPIPDDAILSAPDSIRSLKLLDPACGSGHFLVIAFGLLGTLYIEESRHRSESWSPEQIAEWILENNLHGVDIDPRAIQIAAAALYLKARTFAPDAKIRQLNLVAPTLQLGNLPDDDASVVQLRAELKREVGIPEELTKRLVAALAGVDHLGTLLKVDTAINEALEATNLEIEREQKGQGDLFGGFPALQVKLPVEEAKATVLDKLEQFLARHSTSEDLGLRLDGEQLAAGVRFVRMVKEGTYDVVVGNPPYQGLSKTALSEYVAKNYPLGKADLFAAFLERSLHLARRGGYSAMLAMRAWMFLGQFADLRKEILHKYSVRCLGDLDKGAFETMTTSQLISVCMGIIANTPGASLFAVALQPTAPGEKYWGSDRTDLKRAAMLVHRGRYEFDPKGFEVIEGEPIVYWWSKEFLERYGKTPKLGKLWAIRKGLTTCNNGRFVRRVWELNKLSIVAHRNTGLNDPSGDELVMQLMTCSAWVPWIDGAQGRNWFHELESVVNWQARGLQIACAPINRYGRGEPYYFRSGLAFAMIGANFSSRLHRFLSIIGNMGASIYGTDLIGLMCLLNSGEVRTVLQSLNPGVHFEKSDVDRVAVSNLANSDEIFACIERAFTTHESHREPSVEFKQPGPSPWRYAQDWAQRSVDRAEGEPLPPYEPEYDPPDPESFVSYAIGVALGRFGANGEGILPLPPAPSPLGEGESDDVGSPLAAGRKIAPEMLRRARELRVNQTKAEEILWEHLRAGRLQQFKFRRQHPVGNFIVDFYCHEARLVVEVDGPSHWGTEVRDRDRTDALEALGARVVRFTNTEVENDLESVLTKICTLCESASSVPPLRKERGPGGEATLPAGILFITSDDSLADSLTHPAGATLRAEWDKNQNQILKGKKQDFRDWLRKDFFVYHKGLYENRLIYFPLSSEKRSFVAIVSIHRWADNTLQTLLADHLHPTLRKLDGQIADLNQARASSDKKLAATAEKQYGTLKRLRDELADFITAVSQCAERGTPDLAPEANKQHPKIDAPFHMNLDDGVMINSAALWPLLAPQWNDPKKWWKQLCECAGKKHYDWAHLARRYFPARVEEKCKTDPSLAVAHGFFWKYHPAKAYAWELRLQDEIRAEFTIDEDGAGAARDGYLRDNAVEARAAYEKEMIRRERKAAKGAQLEEEFSEGDSATPEESSDD